MEWTGEGRRLLEMSKRKEPVVRTLNVTSATMQSHVSCREFGGIEKITEGQGGGPVHRGQGMTLEAGRQTPTIKTKPN